MDRKKIVIIGAGVAGLTSGVYALQQGYDVEIYEKHTIPGGECTGWDRGGFHIDNCIHWLMGTVPGTELYKIWRNVGALTDSTPLVPLRSMYTSELNGERITLHKDLARTEEELLALSPADAPEIKKLMAACRKARRGDVPAGVAPELMGPIDGIKLLASTGPMLGLMAQYQGMDTRDLMAKFSHPLIRCLLSDFATADMPAYSFAVSYGGFVAGNGGLPAGGSRAFAFRMRDRFLSLGGRLFYNSPAETFALEGGRVTHLVLQSGEHVPGDYFIPACDPDFVFHHMLDESYMDEVFYDVYHNRAAYPVYSMFQAAFAVDSPVDALGGDITLDIPGIKESPDMSERMTIKIYPYEPGFAPKDHQVLTVLYGGTEGWYDFWAALYRDKAAYEAKKRFYADIFRRRIEERFPEYAGKLTLLDTWSPMTYKRTCNAFKGYNQAYAITKKSRKNPYPSPYLKGLQNAVLAGQWLNAPGGLPGAAITGKYAAQRICKLDGKPCRF